MKLLGALDYTTFDFRIAADGQAYLLDVNADATLYPQRSLAQVARAAGLSYTQLIEAILKTSLERWQTNFG
jgi:D-alanine-D-alanine ligase